jgi:hypothetical protein
MNQVIVFNQVNLIKFYTDIRTGRSGINQTGLATLCKKDLPTISRLIKSLKERKFPKNILLREILNIEDCLYSFNNEIYCNDELSIAIIFYYGLKNPELNALLILIIHRGFNGWIADITGWKRMYRRFENDSSHNEVRSNGDSPLHYQTRMEQAYQVLRDKAFLESCLSH